MTNLFGKPFKTPSELVSLLKTRGLIINDELETVRYLEHIGYNRLSAYMYPFLRVPKKQHIYKDGSSFDNVMKLYRFDKKLRILVFNDIPNRIIHPWISLPADPLRIYFNICIVKYFLNVISPNNDMLAKLC